VQGTESFSGESRHTESSDFFQQFQTASQTSETPVAQEPQKTRAEGTLRFPEQTVQQVGKEIAQFVQRGDRVLKIQLKPAELGTVNIEMDVKENVMKLSVVAETSAAKEMLMASHSELRRVLEGYGVKLDTLNVDLSGSFDQSLADGNGSSFQGESNNSGTGTRFFNNFTNIPEEPLEASVPVERYRSSQLDLMA
jgi:flagellar hook-length control protein FliK